MGNQPFMFIAFYMQHLNFQEEEYIDFDSAYSRLYGLLDNGTGYPLGIYDKDDRVLYVSDELRDYSSNLKRIQTNTEVTPDRIDTINFVPVNLPKFRVEE